MTAPAAREIEAAPVPPAAPVEGPLEQDAGALAPPTASSPAAPLPAPQERPAAPVVSISPTPRAATPPAATPPSVAGDPGPGPRIELSLLSAPFGAGAGALFCAINECESTRGWAASLLGGAALGVTVSALVTSRTGLQYATAQAVEGGALWGMATPLYIWLLANRDASSGRGLFGGMLLGELLGAAVGGVLAVELKPSSGSVALANSGALWLSSMTTLGFFAAAPDFETSAQVRGLGGGLLAAQLIGLGVGAWAGQRFETRRNQVWLSDVGAVLLGGALPLATWLVRGDDLADEELFATAAVGMGAGFALGYLLTELLPRRKQKTIERVASLTRRTQLALLPLRQGGGLQLRASLR